MVNASLNWVSVAGFLCLGFSILGVVGYVRRQRYLKGLMARWPGVRSLRLAWLLLAPASRLVAMPLSAAVLILQGWRFDPLLQLAVVGLALLCLAEMLLGMASQAITHAVLEPPGQTLAAQQEASELRPGRDGWLASAQPSPRSFFDSEVASPRSLERPPPVWVPASTPPISTHPAEQTLRGLGADLARYVRSWGGSSPSAARWQSLVADLVSDHPGLELPLRDLINRPGFQALIARAGSGQGVLERDALMQQLQSTFAPQVLIAVEAVLNGFLDLPA